MFGVKEINLNFCLCKINVLSAYSTVSKLLVNQAQYPGAGAHTFVYNSIRYSLEDNLTYITTRHGI